MSENNLRKTALLCDSFVKTFSIRHCPLKLHLPELLFLAYFLFTETLFLVCYFNLVFGTI